MGGSEDNDKLVHFASKRKTYEATLASSSYWPGAVTVTYYVVTVPTRPQLSDTWMSRLIKTDKVTYQHCMGQNRAQTARLLSMESIVGS